MNNKCVYANKSNQISPVHTLKIACDIPFLTNCQQFITKKKILTRIGNNLNELKINQPPIKTNLYLFFIFILNSLLF